MDNFIEEVEEDIRRDRHLELWRKYGRYAVAAALVVVIAVAATVAWRHYRANERLKDSMAYSAGLSLANQDGVSPDSAIAALGEIVQSGSDSYSVLAQLQQAALLTRSGTPERAVEIYDKLAGDKGLDPIFRDLAVVLRTMVLFDKADGAALMAALAPLTGGSASPWRHSALELTALLAQRGGDSAKAREIYTGLADDPGTPRQLRGRAAEMLAVLGPANG